LLQCVTGSASLYWDRDITFAPAQANGATLLTLTQRQGLRSWWEMKMSGPRYRIGEFAALTGVSIRALHHYDRIGLLAPSARSETGYRLYAQRDLLRLQQVLTLRYLGFPLGAIKDLLARPDFELETSMRIQSIALRDRISALERIDHELTALLEHRVTTGEWDWELATRVSAATQAGLHGKEHQMDTYYSAEELDKRVREVGKDVPAEEIRAVESAWAALLAELHAVRDTIDPASDQARELADRWKALTERTMRGFQSDPKIGASIAENYRRNAYAEVEGAPKPEDFAFIKRVNEARG
jgi:DNA-binding transcriptional MerR regulator